MLEIIVYTLPDINFWFWGMGFYRTLRGRIVFRSQPQHSHIRSTGSSTTSMSLSYLCSWSLRNSGMNVQSSGWSTPLKQSVPKTRVTNPKNCTKLKTSHPNAIANSQTNNVLQLSMVDRAVAESCCVRETPQKLNEEMQTMIAKDDKRISRRENVWDNDSCTLKGESWNCFSSWSSPAIKFKTIMAVVKMTTPKKPSV